MTVNGECGCAAKARSMRIGGVPVVVAPAVEGLATLSAMDHAHTISSWAARRLPAARGTFGDASGGNARGTVSEGGRYHPPGARVGSGPGLAGLSGAGIARRAVAALPDEEIARQTLQAWMKRHPGSRERAAAAAELDALGHPELAGELTPDWISDASEPASRSTSERASSSWARSRGVSVGQAREEIGPRERAVGASWTESPCHSPQLFPAGGEACRNYQRQLAEARAQDRAARRSSPADARPSSWARRRGAPGGESRSVRIGNAAEDLISQLSAAWDTLKTDIFASSSVDATFRAAFMRDAAAWQAFRDSHHGDWMVLHTTLDQIESYRQTLERWRASFVAAGGSPTGHATTAPPPGLLERAQEAAQTPSETIQAVTTSIAIGVTAIAVAWGLSSLRR